MQIIGLTGGIASGKSTVGKMFESLGAVIVDTDRIAHQVVGRGSRTWQNIVDRFGSDILQPNGEIDRKKLAALIFNDPAQRAALDAIVHPAVFARMNQQIEQLQTAGVCQLALLDIPLLFETGMQATIKPIIVVYVPMTLQLQRLMMRDGISRLEALARIRSQWPLARKKEQADYIIDNSRDPDHTQMQVQALYRQLAGGAGIPADLK